MKNVHHNFPVMSLNVLFWLTKALNEAAIADQTLFFGVQEAATVLSPKACYKENYSIYIIPPKSEH